MFNIEIYFKNISQNPREPFHMDPKKFGFNLQAKLDTVQ